MTHDMTNTLKTLAIALIAHEWKFAYPNRKELDAEYHQSKFYWDGAAQNAIDTLIALDWGQREAAVKKPTHQDVRTKKRYVVLCPSAEIAPSKHELIDGKEVTIYQGEDGDVWVRSKEEFLDSLVVIPEEKP